jgi:hypothetical protein
VKGVVVATVGAVLTALVFFAGTGANDREKAAETPKPEVVDGVELDREIDVGVFGSNWSPPIKLPYRTCIFVWVPRGEEIGVQVRSSTKSFNWMNLAEWEQKYSHYGSWDLITFIGMTSHGPNGIHVKYKFSKRPNRGCSLLIRNGVLRTYEDIEQDQVMTRALSIVPGRATDFDPMGYPCVEDNLTPEDIQQVQKVLGKHVTYTASLSAPRAEKTVWFYEDYGKGCDVAYRRYRERGLIKQ